MKITTETVANIARAYSDLADAYVALAKEIGEADEPKALEVYQLGAEAREKSIAIFNAVIDRMTIRIAELNAQGK